VNFQTNAAALRYDPSEQDPEFFISPKIQLTKVAGKDLGIIALEALDEGELIECCPTVLIKYDKRLKWNFLKRFYRTAIVTIFDDYLWWWKGRKQALLLGYGNLYNHSDDFNAASYKREGRKYVFVAKRDIAVGEEITVHYGYAPFCFQDAEQPS